MASIGGVASIVAAESARSGVVQSLGADSSDAHVFCTPVSVRELAQMLADIDMDQMLTGSTLHFTQKTHGCVGMSVLANNNVLGKPTLYRLLETTDGTDWPFLPEILPAAILQSLPDPSIPSGYPSLYIDRWGLLEKRISGLCVQKPLQGDDDLQCVHDAARYVLDCIKNADARVPTSSVDKNWSATEKCPDWPRPLTHDPSGPL